MKIIIELLSTYFYIGYLPAGGTFATLASLPLVMLIHKIDIYLQIILVLIFVGVSIIISSYAEILFGNKDDRKIVIDEIAGFLVATVGINIDNFGILLLLLFIFRIIDITKFGINKIQGLPSGVGIVFDDFIAGIITNLICRIVNL